MNKIERKNVMESKNCIVEMKKVDKKYKVVKRREANFKAVIKSLIKREYQYVQAVDCVNLQVKKGEIRGVIGPNGAGKSTVLKMISGILYPSGGNIQVMGMNPWKDREHLVKNIGVVFGQKGQLWWDLPAIDAFWLNKVMYEIPDSVYEKNLNYFMENLKLHNVIEKPVRNLSLGERMKCEFTCAMIHDPQLVILDEPTIGLDVFSKEEIRSFIKQANKDLGTTFIITTHDLKDVEELCDQITVINNGKITFDDSMRNLQVLYSNRKLLELQFGYIIESKALSKYNVLKFDGISAVIEINLHETTLKDTIRQLWDCLPIEDINVRNISIEQVIKDIY